MLFRIVSFLGENEDFQTDNIDDESTKTCEDIEAPKSTEDLLKDCEAVEAEKYAEHLHQKPSKVTKPLGREFNFC